MVTEKQNTDLPAMISARQWSKVLVDYSTPNHARSLFEIAITFTSFVGLWGLSWAFVYSGYWVVSLLLSLPAAGFLVRLFLIQHDCGHGAFFKRRFANDWTGRIIGILTLTPYEVWRRAHAGHHATTGHLGRRGVGDIKTLTVREFHALSKWGRFGYRLYRHPFVIFCIGPAYQFFLRHRLPLNLGRGGDGRSAKAWISTMTTNLSILFAVVVLVWLIGIKTFLIVHLPIVLFANFIGVWLFYVQHQFEETFWDDDDKWNLHEAALYGSSHYDLPGVLRWFTANIGVHHVHHLCSRIPFYHLPQVLRDHPVLGGVSRLTLRQSFQCIRLVLWDESQRRLISFQDARG